MKFSKKVIYPLLAILFLYFVIGCNKKELRKLSDLESSFFDTVFTLGGMKNGNSIFKTKGGKTIKVEMRNYENEDESYNYDNNQSAGQTKSKKCVSDEFAGKDRKDAKTSVVTSEYRDFQSLDELLISLPPDTKMENYEPKITKSVKSRRVEEEMRNVKIERAYIYAIYREPDNDFHIILGSSTVSNGREYLNVEVSGLPAAGSDSYNALFHARKEVVDYFGDLNCGKKYIFGENPVEVEVEGSLFYDIDHAPGVVGQGQYKPATSWEIHPVTGISFK